MILLANPWGETLLIPRFLERAVALSLHAAGWAVYRVVSP